MDNNLSRRQRKLGQGNSAVMASRVDLREFKPYRPPPLPNGVQEKMDSYRAIPSYWERVK